MYPKTHILFGLIFCVILFVFFPNISLLGLLCLFLSAVLIDVDHYIYFIFKKKNLSLNKSYIWFKELKEYGLKHKREIYLYKWPNYTFHNVEFLLVVLVLYFIWPFFGFLFIGLLLHFFLDFLDDLSTGLPITMKLSLVYLLIRNKNKKTFN
ncbi:Uncharacterised protein [uncultured archaeon]|nr:Uncharacterised protein [uncultured archaeon]